MKKPIILMLAAIAAAGCSRHTTAAVETGREYVRSDTVRCVQRTTDSIFLHDSIYVEGERREVYRTLCRYVAVHDTVAVARTDTVRITATAKVPVATEKPLSLMDKAALLMGHLLMAALVILAIYRYIILKTKKI